MRGNLNRSHGEAKVTSCFESKKKSCLRNQTHFSFQLSSSSLTQLQLAMTLQPYNVKKLSSCYTSYRLFYPYTLIVEAW